MILHSETHLDALTRTLTALAPALKNHLWQSTIFALVAALLTLALRHNQARTRYWLWLAASLKFLVPLSLFVTLGSHLAMTRPQAAAPQAIYFAMQEATQPFTPTFETIAPPAAPANHLTLAHLIPTIVAALWLCGFAIIVLGWIVQLRRIAATIRAASPATEGRELDALRRIESLSGATKLTRLLLSSASLEPGIGIVRPTLLWPARITDHLEDAHLDAILAHELCHVRRRDNLTAALHMLVSAVFWFHPQVWFLGARLLAERERACDEAVLHLSSQPRLYAESILKVCEFCLESPLPCVSGVTGANLKSRIATILTNPITLKLSLSRKLLLLAIGLAVVAVPIVLGQGKAAQQMMLAAVNAAPMPFRTAARAMIALEDIPSTGLIENQTEVAQAATVSDAAIAAAAMGPAFEVASIRPTAGAPGSSTGISVTPSGRVHILRETVLSLAYFSYLPHVGTGLVQGGPAWTNTREYDIDATVGDAEAATWGELSDAQRTDRVRLMLRRLLAERFQVKMRTETQVKPVFALVQAKGGAKLRPVDAPPLNADQEAVEAWEKSGNWTAEKAPPGTFLMTGSTWVGKALPISQLLTEIAINAQVDRLVVDETGLRGSYDFTFKPSYDKDAPLLLNQIADQLGLKLEPRKLPVKIYVIDSAERPSVDGAESSAPDPTSLTQVSPVAEQAAVAPIKVLEFDVVSIKPSRQGELRIQDMPMDMPDGFNAQANPLLDLIRAAYGPTKFPANDRIVGAPDWAKQQGFDIQAKVAPSDVDTFQKMSFDQRRPMLQAILAERFKLKVHNETRQFPIYELVIGKGPKLKEATPDDVRPNGLKDIHGQPLNVGIIKFVRPSEAVAQATSMASLANLMSQPFLGIGRPVIDKTGLTGTYDFILKWTPDQTANGAHPVDDSAPSIFTAIEEQLGLKLRPSTGPVEVLVIDHVEKPSEN